MNRNDIFREKRKEVGQNMSWGERDDLYQRGIEMIGYGIRNEGKCLHLSCSKCHGTGTDSLGNSCIHMISCPCPKCSPGSL